MASWTDSCLKVLFFFFLPFFCFLKEDADTASDHPGFQSTARGQKGKSPIKPLVIPMCLYPKGSSHNQPQLLQAVILPEWYHQLLGYCSSNARKLLRQYLKLMKAGSGSLSTRGRCPFADCQLYQPHAMLFGAEQAEVTAWRGKVVPVTVLGGDRPGTCSATASTSDHQPPEQARFLLARSGVTAAEGFNPF